MPIQSHLSDPQIQAIFWQIDSEEFTQRNIDELPAAIQPRLAQRKSAVHRQGFWAVREACKALALDPNQITYASDGAPLYPSVEISISHSKSMALVGRSESPLGVDVEQFTPKIHRIQKRFHHPQESFEGDETQGLVQLWTAKEALYKTLRIPGISFKEQLRVAPFSVGDTQGTASFIEGDNLRHFDLYYFYGEAYVASIAIEHLGL